MNRYNMMIDDCRLTAKAELVMRVLIDHMNRKTRECWPSLKTVAKECRLSVSSVQRGLRELMEHGIIRKEARFRANGSQTSNVYIIILEAAERIIAATENVAALAKQRFDYICRRMAAAEAKKLQVSMLPSADKGHEEKRNCGPIKRLFSYLTTPLSHFDYPGTYSV